MMLSVMTNRYDFVGICHNVSNYVSMHHEILVAIQQGPKVWDQ